MRVVHCRRQPYTVYIGRPSVFGNPYVIDIDGGREEVITKYQHYAEHDENLLAAIAALPEDAVLGCWCRPFRCHGDAIVEIWKRLNAG